MKILFPILITCITIVGCMQLGQKNELKQFIKSHGDFIALTNISALNNTVVKCIPLIKTYLDSKNDSIENYYIDTSRVRIEGSSLSIPLWHIDGFTKQLNYKKDGLIIIGNASGKDGLIKIDLTKMKVKGFLLWQ